eukprot:423589-Amphidinium_carterae.1
MEVEDTPITHEEIEVERPQEPTSGTLGDEAPSVQDEGNIERVAEATMDLDQGLVLAECVVSTSEHLVKKSSDEVKWSEIPAKDQPMFLSAMEKEIRSMLEVNKAMTVLSLEESLRVRRENPDRIIASRIHLRYKPVEGEDGKGLKYVAKA